jgi:acylglycerol lipase
VRPLERWNAGGDLAAYRLLPDTAHAVALCVHGFAEHVGRHERVIRRFAERGIATYAYDHRGHGNSPGTRALVPRFQTLVDEAQRMRERVVAEQPALPFFLVGISMGGLIAIRMVEQQPEGIRGAVLVAPALDIASRASPFGRAIAPLVARIAPNYPVGKPRTRMLSRNPRVGEAFMADPLTYKEGAPIRSAVEILRAGVAALYDASRFSVPAWVAHGTADRVTAIGGTRLFVSAIGTSDVTLREIAGAYHEVFNEPGGDALIDEAAVWIVQHATRAS